MAFSKGFWDVFPKWMTALWIVSIIAMVVATFLWQDAVYVWFAGEPGLVVIGIFTLLVLVFIGNYVPGIPNMLLPLFAGWAFGTSASFVTVLNVGMLTWLIAALGSKLIYVKARNNPFIVLNWNLNTSKRFNIARDAVESEPNVIIRSRIGKFAAYCGHVNIAAGVAKYPNDKFTDGVMLGHALWTLQYLALGFLIGYLPKIRDFVVTYPYLSLSGILCVMIVVMIVYIARHRRKC
jgi:membrane protein DedA with SNARE-associated domain